MKNLQFNYTRWISISLINFFIVALAGVVLRYKINFALPIINQKNLLHGHSHFAFAGWVSLVLMALMINYLSRSGVATNYSRYTWLLRINNLIAYGMLITFTMQGYAMFSIIFSTLSIFVSFFFIYWYWTDLNQVKDGQSINLWFKFALILLGFSSIGPFMLAYLMASHIFVQNFYFSAIYFFLHFQYNGWFIFACLGLLFSFLKEKKEWGFLKISKHLFYIMALTVVPTYLLSIIGLKVPLYLHWIAAIAAFMQLAVLYYSYQLLRMVQQNLQLAKISRLLWLLAYLSFSIKILLQALSAIPYFTTFAFNLRPVVIAYLHLCFLGVISFFILGYCVEYMAKAGIKLSKTGLLIFIYGVFLQEGVLLAQGLEAIVFNNSLQTGIALFIAAILMAGGLAIVSMAKVVDKKEPL
jgi:hypothetical protein